MSSLSRIKRASKDKLILTQKQENFALNLFNDMPQNEAWGLSGYSTNYSPAAISVNACRLANSTKVKLRIQELRDQAANGAVMTLQEMLETHTEIARGRVGHFLDDNQRIEQGTDLNSAAIQELDTSEITIGKGENAKLATITKIKLRDPVPSLQALAKLQGFNPKEAQGGNTYNDIKVLIVREKPKEIDDAAE